MGNETTTPGYMLLFRGTNWDRGLSPEQIEEVAGRFMAWFDRLTAEGTVKAGQPLQRGGKVVSGRNGRTVADGPFAESKEAIGGYFLLQVADLDEAVKVARDCPILEYGASVEVRPVASRCPMMDLAMQQNAAGAVAGVNA